MFAFKGLRAVGGVVSNRRSTSSFITKFDDAVNKLPLKEAVRYINHNMKWTAGNIQSQIDAQGHALVDLEYQAGESIGVWFPECAEKHVVMMAAAKIGLRVFEIDSKINTVAQARKFLTASKCKSLWFQPMVGEDNKLLLLRKAIPEFFEYDDTYGQYFHSKHFPELTFFIQSGNDVQLGCLPYSGMFLPHPQDDLAGNAHKKVSDDSPFYTYIAKGDNDSDIVVSPTITRAQLLEHPNWSFAKKIIQGEYFECDDRAPGQPALDDGHNL